MISFASKQSFTGAEDTYIWLPHKAGLYTTKSGYHMAVSKDSPPAESTLPNHNFSWNSEIWAGSFHQNLVKRFLWKVMQGALPVGENLVKRSVITIANCASCGELESTSHFFLRIECGDLPRLKKP